MSDERPRVEEDLDEHSSSMSLARISWSVTAFVFLVVGVVLLVQGYVGYAIVTLVIGAAAALNLL